MNQNYAKKTVIYTLNLNCLNFFRKSCVKTSSGFMETQLVCSNGLAFIIICLDILYNITICINQTQIKLFETKDYLWKYAISWSDTKIIRNTTFAQPLSASKELWRIIQLLFIKFWLDLMKWFFCCWTKCFCSLNCSAQWVFAQLVCSTWQ